MLYYFQATGGKVVKEQDIQTNTGEKQNKLLLQEIEDVSQVKCLRYIMSQGYPIKRPYIPLTIATRVLGCENNL